MNELMAYEVGAPCPIRDDDAKSADTEGDRTPQAELRGARCGAAEDRSSALFERAKLNGDERFGFSQEFPRFSYARQVVCAYFI